MAVRVRVLIETLRHDGRRPAVGDELTLAPAAAAALIALRAVAAVGGRDRGAKDADGPAAPNLGAGASVPAQVADRAGPVAGAQDPEPTGDPDSPEAPAPGVGTESPAQVADPVDLVAGDQAPAPTGGTESPDTPAPGVGAEGDPFGRPSINTASASALAKVPGLGTELARAVVAHRKAKGPFASVQDLVVISGIGPKKAAALAELVTL